jgi:hypothetical protein
MKFLESHNKQEVNKHIVEYINEKAIILQIKIPVTLISQN